MRKTVHLIVAVLFVTAVVVLASNYAIAGSSFSAKKYEKTLTKYLKANPHAKSKFSRMLDDGEGKLSDKGFTRADVVTFVKNYRLKKTTSLMDLTIGDWKKDSTKVDDTDIAFLEKIIKSSRKVLSKL